MKMINKKFYLVNICVLLSLFFLVINFCSAAFLSDPTKNTIDFQANEAATGYDTNANIYGLIQTVINAFLSLIGVILLVYILYAGYNWMTAQGEEEKVTKAKDTLKRAIIGIIIIVGAYAISVFVMSRLEAGTLRGGNNTTATPSPIGPLE